MASFSFASANATVTGHSLEATQAEAKDDANRKADVLSDVGERQQQQLAKINEDENLKIGERHYNDG